MSVWFSVKVDAGRDREILKGDVERVVRAGVVVLLSGARSVVARVLVLAPIYGGNCRVTKLATVEYNEVFKYNPTR